MVTTRSSTKTAKSKSSSPSPDGGVSSNILEKGIIYFFFRGRVNINNPNSIQDIARTYFVLRPLPPDKKLTANTIKNTDNARLIALPKKVFPKGPRDRFLAFVETGSTSFEDLKNKFIAASDYETETVGSRHVPEATLVGEGVYTISATGEDSRRNTHLAYILTVPSPLGKVQEDIGIRERGSFIVSVRNPSYEYRGPLNTGSQLPRKPEYPKDLQQTFQNLRWTPLDPIFLNYTNTQILLIGGDSPSHSHSGKTKQEEEEKDTKDDTKSSGIDENENEDEVEVEIERLERDDEVRIEGMRGTESEAIFHDLGLSAEHHKGIGTTW